MKKTIIITGGSQGLGLQTSKILAADKNVSLIIGSRNLKKTEKIAGQLIKDTGNPKIYGLQLDLADFNSIKEFVHNFLQLNLSPLQVLINNAGIQYVSETKYTEQGYELTFGVNHLGHFFLTQLLTPHINKNGKIFNVASGVHNPELKTGMPNPVYSSARKLAFPGSVDLKENLRKQGQIRYSTSKLCNILFTYKLADKYEQQATHIQVFAFDPGMMPGTGLANDYPVIIRFLWKYIMPVQTLFNNRVNTPEQSGKILADWVLNNKTDKSSLYFYAGGEEPSSKLSYDKDLQENLWDFSMKEVRKWL
ncbi:SDR family NAD(P)-dependent oxidoreductase [Abyssalbus ytuae]|uniref:SDR family NAD(P)-dependent oxidoreductase n=1 Tax=Abyssalbus ytuae TaxID=2926907 RepID=A0A9E6ZNA4_9FLAO|nr:SDR family NAD(P)-dependent oxidoreductase [Abyssalbus ytuae]UOB17445.1 SDR family NAD(P)-dependent oxidoreductase [Abyssalbus ytuae]